MDASNASTLNEKSECALNLKLARLHREYTFMQIHRLIIETVESSITKFAIRKNQIIKKVVRTNLDEFS